MNPDTAQGLLIILFSSLAIISLEIVHQWNKIEQRQIKEQKEREAKRERRFNPY